MKWTLNFFGDNAKLDHVGIVVPDIKNILPDSNPIFDPHQNVNIEFALICGVPHELISPVDQTSPVFNMLKKGVHTYHTCYSVPSIGEAMFFAKSFGFRAIDKIVNAPALEDRNILWVASRTFGIFEIVECP